MARFAVSKIGHRKAIKVIKSMTEGVVTEVITAFTVHPKMPLSYKERKTGSIFVVKLIKLIFNMYYFKRETITI